VTDGPQISVIVPVLNDADRLECCLAAIDGQETSRSLEIIVADNGSTDHVSEVVARHRSALLIHEPTRSSYAARNAAVRVSRGSILVFTDADCLPQPDWIEEGTRALLDTGRPALVGGHIDVFPVDPASQTPVETYELLHGFPQRKYAERFSFSTTANLFVTREVFDRVGDFNGWMVSGGDLDWGRRAADAGVPTVYAENARVAHPARRTWVELRGKGTRLQIGKLQRRVLDGKPLVGPYLAVRLGRPPLKSALACLRAGQPPGFKNKLAYLGVVLGYHYAQLWDCVRAVVRRDPRIAAARAPVKTETR
jgi:glycosyltransferase involved in cell wall biosynthesis